MTAQTIFAYAQGTDLEDVAELLEARCEALTSERAWQLGDVWVVNQRVPELVSGNAVPAAEWDLGFNLTLPAKSARPTAWMDDVLAIAATLGALQRETGRTFVIGIHDKKTDEVKDLFFVESPEPDVEKLKAALTAATAKSPRRNGSQRRTT